MMDPDLLFAKKLQEEFNRERFTVQSPKAITNASKKDDNSIVDSKWEIYDPNPDIYTLFQLFNSKFFWNQLGSVEVKWSPRMYSCAGICTYKGRQGCVVSLSLPLLKLRPRKDLVETLLHEMIHAYLFVTDKNSEREEHGPKFHSHMYRINKAAGTNITVYHTFHDEVKHYKTHWWRCNGPCRFRHPYFGLVKRSMNRPPGPNDFWFGEHKLTCGGEFIKVKEPDGFKSRKSKKANTNKENSGKQQSLDKYLSPPHPSKTKTNANIGNMNGYNKNENMKTPVEKLGKSNNIHGFKGFTPNNTVKTNASYINKNSGKIGSVSGMGIMSNRSGTLLEKPRTIASSSSTPKTTQVASTFTPYIGTGQILDPNCKQTEINRANSRLLNLYPVQNKTSSSSTTKDQNPPKKPKIEKDNTFISLLDDSVEEIRNYLVNCPVCNKELTQDQVNEHLDVCMNLDAVMESITDTVVVEDELEEKEDIPSDIVNCPNCDEKCTLDSINLHLDECLQTD